jgi:gelsolin
MYGKFYDGDSYVVLHTSRVGGGWQWTVHFWIGENSSQDEYGAAAVWTVQIDDKLGGAATQHREVQDFESQQFLSYFNPGIQILKGGIESAFRHVDRDEHRDRLLKVKGAKNVRITEVPCYPNSLNSGDVFVLDTKDFIYEWIGKSSSIHERRKGGELCTAIRNERGAKPTIITIEESRGEDDPRFWEALGGKGPVMSAAEGGDDFSAEAEKRTEKKLFKLSDASGRLQFTQVATGKVLLNLFQTNDVFVFDSGFEIFLWIGKGASPAERSAGFGQAQEYLRNSGKPSFLPVTKIQQTVSYPETFTASLDG